MIEPNQEAFDLYAHGVNFCRQHDIPLNFLRVCHFSTRRTGEGVIFNGTRWIAESDHKPRAPIFGSLYLEAPHDEISDFITRQDAKGLLKATYFYCNKDSDQPISLYAIDKGHDWSMPELRYAWSTVQPRNYVQVNCFKCDIAVEINIPWRDILEREVDLQHQLASAFTPVCKVPNDKK